MKLLFIILFLSALHAHGNDLGMRRGGNTQQESGAKVADFKSVGDSLTDNMSVDSRQDPRRTAQRESLQGDVEKQVGSNPAVSKSFQPWCARASNLRGSISNAPPLTASQRNAARNHAIHLVKWRKGRRKELKIPTTEGSTPSLTIAPHLAFTAELRLPYVDQVKLAKGDK